MIFVQVNLLFEIYTDMYRVYKIILKYSEVHSDTISMEESSYFPLSKYKKPENPYLERLVFRCGWRDFGKILKY